VIYLLDNNVIAETWRETPSERVLVWLYAHEEECFLPVPVIAEIQAGAEATPSAARRAAINGKLDSLLLQYGQAILPWDMDTARTWGRLRHSPEVRRRPQPLWDSLIDALAVRHGATVATRNTQDFRHAPTLNPFTA